MAPPSWWWRDHRIPRELDWIERGVTIDGELLTTYIVGWLYYVIPNLNDVLGYMRRRGLIQNE